MAILWTLVQLFIVLPIWYYLLYQILVRVNASELMWFLFWVYVPVSLFVTALMKVVEQIADGKQEKE